MLLEQPAAHRLLGATSKQEGVGHREDCTASGTERCHGQLQEAGFERVRLEWKVVGEHRRRAPPPPRRDGHHHVEALRVPVLHGALQGIPEDETRMLDAGQEDADQPDEVDGGGDLHAENALGLDALPFAALVELLGLVQPVDALHQQLAGPEAGIEDALARLGVCKVGHQPSDCWRGRMFATALDDGGAGRDEVPERLARATLVVGALERQLRHRVKESSERLGRGQCLYDHGVGEVEGERVGARVRQGGDDNLPNVLGKRSV